MKNNIQNYDSERIAVGEVFKEEICQLEEKLLTMYFELAKTSGKKLVIHTDRQEYESLRESELFDDPNNLYLLMDQYHSQVLDKTPLIFHLADTEEGRFYAKYSMLLEANHQS